MWHNHYYLKISLYNYSRKHLEEKTANQNEGRPGIAHGFSYDTNTCKVIIIRYPSIQSVNIALIFKPIFKGLQNTLRNRLHSYFSNRKSISLFHIVNKSLFHLEPEPEPEDWYKQSKTHRSPKWAQSLLSLMLINVLRLANLCY